MNGFNLDDLSDLYLAALREHLTPFELQGARWETYGKGVRVFHPRRLGCWYVVHHDAPTADNLHVHVSRDVPPNLEYCCC